MKTNIEIYKPGTRVYVIDRMHDNEGKVTNYVMIIQAIVDNVMISDEGGVEYWLKTPSGEEWGGSVSENDVDEEYNVLLDKCEINWLNDSIYK